MVRRTVTKGGSLASDALCDATNPGAFDGMDRNFTNMPLTIFVHNGGALQNIVDRKLVADSLKYTLRNQAGGHDPATAAKIVPTVPVELPQPSGTLAYNYNLLPNGVLATLSQPLASIPAANNTVAFPSYYNNYQPPLSGGKKRGGGKRKV